MPLESVEEAVPQVQGTVYDVVDELHYTSSASSFRHSSQQATVSIRHPLKNLSLDESKMTTASRVPPQHSQYALFVLAKCCKLCRENGLFREHFIDFAAYHAKLRHGSLVGELAVVSRRCHARTPPSHASTC